MIAIVSPTARERVAFATLCASRGWPSVAFDSLRAFRRALRRTKPKVVLVRHALPDGYSDDLIAALGERGLLPAAKIIVLVAAGTSSTVEARQVSLGADCVQRDPVRTNVLLEYVAKYFRSPRASVGSSHAAPAKTVSFAGAVLNPEERLLRHGSQETTLTPREVELVELLIHSQGEVVTYDTLYHEILNRSFRGDTSNMRVLLGKLNSSAALLGIALRQWVEVIPKTGYRYRGTRLRISRTTASGSPFLTAA